MFEKDIDCVCDCVCVWWSFLSNMKERNGDGWPRERKWVWGRKRMMMCVREKKHIVDFKTFWLSVHQSIGVWVVFEIESKLKTLTGSYIQLTRQSLIKILSFFFFIFTLGYLALKLTYLNNNICAYITNILEYPKELF